MASRSNSRHRVVAALSVLKNGENAMSLADFMSEDDGALHSELVEEYSKHDDADLSADKIVRHLVSSDRFSSLAEVHPAWIVEKLRDESPRIIGIILRFLPSQHVKYVLKHLPPMLCEQVPKMLESFSVHPEILDVIRKKFEKKFVPMRISRRIERPGFENLYYLKESELNELFIELGLEEIACALSGMSTKVLRMIYNRLDIKDAKRLKAKIGEILPTISSEMFRKARSNLLQIESEHVGPKQMLKMVGLGVLAEAIDADDEDFIRKIQQRMDPKEGYLLKRFVDERKIRPSAVSCEMRQAAVLKAMGVLAREERIDGVWNDMAPEAEEANEPICEPQIPSWDEETNTYHELA